MTSEVKKAKDHCGYEPKPVLPVCVNCAAFRREMVTPAWLVKNYPDGELGGNPLSYYAQEKNLRCADHGFAVKKMATCRLFKEKDPTK